MIRRDVLSLAAPPGNVPVNISPLRSSCRVTRHSIAACAAFKSLAPVFFIAEARQIASHVRMRMFFPILTALIFVIIASAADTNSPATAKNSSTAPMKIGTLDATNYYDQTIIVTGKVVQVTIRPSVTFLNLDRPFPDSPFAVVIIHGKSSYYGDANALKGK